MNTTKLIAAGICGAAVLLVLTAMGAAWYVALAAGFSMTLVAGAVLHARAGNPS